MKKLCESCGNLKKMEFGTDAIRVCNVFKIRLKRYPDQCNRFEQFDHNIHDFYRTAWILEKQKKPGFEVPDISFQKPKGNEAIDKVFNDQGYAPVS